MSDISSLCVLGSGLLAVKCLTVGNFVFYRQFCSLWSVWHYVIVIFFIRSAGCEVSEITSLCVLPSGLLALKCLTLGQCLFYQNTATLAVMWLETMLFPSWKDRPSKALFSSDKWWAAVVSNQFTSHALCLSYPGIFWVMNISNVVTAFWVRLLTFGM